MRKLCGISAKAGQRFFGIRFNINSARATARYLGALFDRVDCYSTHFSKPPFRKRPDKPELAGNWRRT